MSRKNPMKYFSGNAFARLPLYKLLAGGLAATMAAGVGIGAMAAAVTAPKMEVPAAEAMATPEPTAQPVESIEIEAEAETVLPEISMDVTVVQQDIGVQLYTMVYPELPVFDDPEQAMDYILPEPEKQPTTGLPATVLITDAEGETEEYAVDETNGTALAEDLTPGEYTVALQPLDGYQMPYAEIVTVKEKVVYKADVSAVKEKIVQASAVVESQEDNGFSGGGQPNNITDTVPYAESKVEEISTGEETREITEKVTVTTYTAQTNGEGFLLMKDGSATSYRPCYDDNNNLTGAVLVANAGISSRSMDMSIHYLGNATQPAMFTLLEGETEEPVAAQEMPAEAEPAPEQPVESAPEQPTPAPTAEPTPTPAPTAEPTPTPAPTAEPTPAPTAPPAAVQLPEALSVEELISHGFAVTVNTEEKEVPTGQTETISVTKTQYTGWQTINGAQYYYHPDTHEPVTGTQVIQGDIYNFDNNGTLKHNNRGIDVSKFQGNIDWNAVKADGITFAIIRCGYRGYGSGALVEDSTFRANIAGAKAAGLQVGVYFYSQAITEEEAVEEASMVISLCSGYSLPYGVYYDTEKVDGGTGRADGISAAQRTACAVAFCETIRNAGYTPGVYSYAAWFYNNLNFANISRYRIWIAQYRDKLNFSYGYNIWQYTGSGRVKGISKPVDMNIG